MNYNTKEKIEILLNEVSQIKDIKAIGKTGDANIIPMAGESDIDIFVFGKKIPNDTIRKEVYDKNHSLYESYSINVCEGGVWGTGDIFTMDGVETMLMYFTIDETNNYLGEILAGEHIDSLGRFYPIGRCATLRNLNIIYDENEVLESLKEKLFHYPNDLKSKTIDFHLNKVLDEEDFGRAVRRCDVLFYHQVLEVAIDHYLQSLFAVNETYFPSRKRTEQYIDSFRKKPRNCYERLLEVLRFGSTPDGIEISYKKWCELVRELKFIYEN